jgi:hypothetical protein
VVFVSKIYYTFTVQGTMTQWPVNAKNEVYYQSMIFVYQKKYTVYK